MATNPVSPSLRVSAGLSPDDAAVLSALSEAHGMPASEILRWAIRWYAYSSPGELEIESISESLSMYLLQAPLGPPYFVPSENAHTDKGDNGKVPPLGVPAAYIV